MGEVRRFVPRSEQERARLIRDARAHYDSVFPPTDRVPERRDDAFAIYMPADAEIDRGDEGVS